MCHIQFLQLSGTLLLIKENERDATTFRWLVQSHTNNEWRIWSKANTLCLPLHSSTSSSQWHLHHFLDFQRAPLLKSEVVIWLMLSGRHFYCIFIHYFSRKSKACRGPSGSGVKKLHAVQESLKTRVWSLGWEDPLEEEMAIHPGILAGKIPWME